MLVAQHLLQLSDCVDILLKLLLILVVLRLELVFLRIQLLSHTFQGSLKNLYLIQRDVQFFSEFGCVVVELCLQFRVLLH